jgi:hypothetical protein
MKYFRHNKFASFQRQLNLYGFRKVTRGTDAGAYAHHCFRKGQPDLLSYVRRAQSPTPSPGSPIRETHSSNSKPVLNKIEPQIDNVYQTSKFDAELKATQEACKNSNTNSLYYLQGHRPFYLPPPNDYQGWIKDLGHCHTIQTSHIANSNKQQNLPVTVPSFPSLEPIFSANETPNFSIYDYMKEGGNVSASLIENPLDFFDDPRLKTTLEVVKDCALESNNMDQKQQKYTLKKEDPPRNDPHSMAKGRYELSFCSPLMDGPIADGGLGQSLFKDSTGDMYSMTLRRVTSQDWGQFEKELKVEDMFNEQNRESIYPDGYRFIMSNFF